MLGRIQLGITCLLVAALGGFLWFELARSEESREAVVEIHSRIDALLAEVGQLQVVASSAAMPDQSLPSTHPTIRIGDTVRITDDYNPELNAEKGVAADGKILVPDVGWIHVVGLTREEAEGRLQEACDPFFVDTAIHVEVCRDPVIDTAIAANLEREQAIEEFRSRQSLYKPSHLVWKNLQAQIERLER